jgi:membrane protein implicated in regulation of membrane protease activity
MTDERTTQSLGDMIDDVLALITGGTAALLPAFILAVPCIVLIVVPVLMAGIVAAVLGGLVFAVVAPPVLLARSVRRRRHPA